MYSMNSMKYGLATLSSFLTDGRFVYFAPFSITHRFSSGDVILSLFIVQVQIARNIINTGTGCR